MAVAIIGPKFYAWDRNGLPLAFGKVYTYQARTNDPKPTFQSEDGLVENTNPVILNGEGYANIYLDGSYKIVVKDSDDNEIWTADPVTDAQATEWVNCVPATYVSTTSFRVAVNVTDIYEVGRRVRLSQGGPDFDYANIIDSSYAANETTVTVSTAIVTVGLIEACVSILGPQSTVAIRDYQTIDEAKLDQGLSVGDYISVEDYATGNMSGTLYFKVVAGGTGTEDGGEFINLPNGLQLQQNFNMANGLNVRAFGAKADGIFDCANAIEAAARYLMRGEYPGGDLWFPNTGSWYYLGTRGHDFWQYLLDEQGLVDGDLYLPGGNDANGKLVRGTYMGVKGDGLVKMKTAKGGNFTTDFLFKWGRYLGTPVNAGVGMGVDGVDIEGPGDVGHTATNYIPGAGGYSSTTNANIGTTDTTTTCFDASLISPMGRVRNSRVRYFNKAIENEFGFGVSWESGSIQWCNIGANPRTNTTNFSLGEALEIELCAIGLWSERADAILVNGTIIEANQAEVMIQQSRFVTFNDAWFEGAAGASVFMRNVPASPNTAFDNRNITFNNCVGLNVDSNGSLRNFRANRCPLNLGGETFGVSVGEVFEDVVYDNCTITGDPFDLDSLSTSGLITNQDVKIIGAAVNKSAANYGSRLPDKLYKNVSTAVPTAQEGFRVDVANAYTNCRIEITGSKSAAGSADDVQYQTFKYVGVLTRRPGQNPVIDWDTTRSYVNNHTATGTNVPISVATPTVTTVSGGAADAQVLSFDFPTGTAVSNTADTRFDVELQQQNDVVELA
tara:strand:+ start:13845 stop:16196 length:2352 start_codon:yes stop_codon:yes gene_type:complete